MTSQQLLEMIAAPLNPLSVQGLKHNITIEAPRYWYNCVIEEIDTMKDYKDYGANYHSDDDNLQFKNINMDSKIIRIQRRFFMRNGLFEQIIMNVCHPRNMWKFEALGFFDF